MEYLKLSKIYDELGSTTKRLKKTEIISSLLKHVPKKEIGDIIYLLEGRVFPAWDERKIGFSDRLMLKAISIASGTPLMDVENLWSKKGDLGLVAEELLDKKKQHVLAKKNLSTEILIENVRKLAELTGGGAVAKKISLVTKLLSNAKPDEAKYVVRTILEQLRIGIAKGIVRDAIAKAFKKNVKDVEDAFDLTVDYGEVAELARENKLGRINLRPGRPLNVMLAILVNNVKEGFEYLGRPIQLEFKIDGFRLQIHKTKDDIRLFTRRMEDVTKQFPDVVEYIKSHVSGKSFILDSEAVSIDKKNDKYLPFQTISQRIRRKYDIEKNLKKFPVELNAFDILYYNGKNLMNKVLGERRKLLEKIIKQEKWKIVLTKKLVTSDEKEAKEFFNKALESGVEGIMLKNLKANYRPGRYVGGWCKLKNILEPLDVVITKAEYGEGKRAKLLSSYTIACQDKGKLLEIGKVSTGVKEKEGELTYEGLTKMLKPLITNQKGKEVTIRPKIVIEVRYEEVQKSPTYSSGYALRFPRVLRLRVNEKNVKDISTIEDVKKIFGMQRGKFKRK